MIAIANPNASLSSPLARSGERTHIVVNPDSILSPFEIFIVHSRSRQSTLATVGIETEASS
ncbi:hypothetical protein CU103_25525 [Phyllobacterium sophorae]|uniref:Uncharacterized protein n=1 Tax=Phyllobacterium sophorae TaxID=1520277 RepID=A0A2P7B378_9HYPH|nr:hypothetical protein CU103_25525 [Phyllobacterium sophorae]